MKKRIRKLLAATVLFLSIFAAASPGLSVSAATKVQAKVTASSLNVRAKASTSAKKVGLLKKGKTVTVTQEKGGWTKIPFGSSYGWVSSKYLSKIKTAAASAASLKSGYVTSSSLNLRKSNTTSSASLATLKKGTLVNIQSTKGTWYKIYVPSVKKTGWVSKSYISSTKPATAAASTSAKGTAYYVTASSLNVRKTASTSAKKVALVKKNDKVTVYKKSGKWGYLKTASGVYGWASISYLTTKAPAKSAPAKDNSDSTKASVYYVTASTLNIRSTGSTSGKVVATVKKNDKVTVTTINSNNWGKVTTASGIVGWASMKYLTTTVPQKGIAGKVIVIDAGHGGKDPGAGPKGEEKVLTLVSAKALKAKLEDAGATVVMTRSGDTYPSLSERVKISHKYNADVFISIHYNSNPNKSAEGIETYYYSTNVNEYTLARLIQEEVIKATGLRSRGVKEGNFHVIRENKQSAVLLELGFVSNPDELEVLKTEEFQEKAAQGIYNALERYFN